MSLATENNIEGEEYGMRVEPFFDPYPENANIAEAIRDKIDNFPLYQGSLVANDGSGTLIIAEVLDEHRAEETYLALTSLVERIELPAGISLHIAGEAAVSGFLGMYIANDAQRLNPVAGLIITIILFIAFRTLAGALLPNLIVAATVVGAVGIMSALGVSFFVITNAMPVVLIGIAVADSIHIFSAYYESLSRQKDKCTQKAVLEAMNEMWRPITLTSLTTIAGFLGLYISSVQPPMQYMGLFTALGVAIAWIYSMTFLPAAMSYLTPGQNRLFDHSRQSDPASLLMSRLGRLVVNNPGLLVGVGLSFIAAGILGALNIKVDERRIETFNEREAIYIADAVINEHFNGTSVFDIVIETDEPEALFNPRYLRKIEALQAELATYEFVGGTTSVVDYLKQINRSLNEGDPSEYRLVDDEQLIAQLFLLYSTSGDPTDFEEEIDYDYQRANIRVNLKGPAYTDLKPLVAAINTYIVEEFNEPDIRATLSGRAMVTYEWVDAVGESHFQSVLVSLLLVFSMAALVFRSLVGGILSLIPVATSILFVYAVMVVFDIDIGIGTSMFASVAIGLGVDFAIHTIDRIRSLFTAIDGSDDCGMRKQMMVLYPTTGRALVFNLLAIACGFGVLMSSEVVPLMRFGAIVALSVSSAFLFSLTFLPALVLIIKPAFLFAGNSSLRLSASAYCGLLLLVLLGLTSLAGSVQAATASIQHELTGTVVMQKVVARDDGEFVSRNLTMELTDRRGKSRVRTTRGYRKYYGTEKRTVLFYTSPANVKDTGFLTYDYLDTEVDDDQWLYLPAARKIRRISASDRGDYFLGTDFSFEDIKNEAKPSLADYQHLRLEDSVVDGKPCIVVEGIPVSEKVARELGYSRVVTHVDPDIWMARKTEFWDIKGNPLKVIKASDIVLVDGIWTTHRLMAENLKTGHKTIFTFSDVDYRSPVEDDWFESRKLRRGL